MAMVSLKNIARDIRIFIESPIPYLYSYTYSNKETVKIEAFSQDVKQTGDQIVEKIKEDAPSLIVHFVGSAVLQIPGQRDIDLFVECNPNEFEKYLPIMSNLFGPPQKSRDKFHEWHFNENNCTVEIIFGDPTLPLFTEPLQMCALIASKPEYIKEYAQIKADSNGITVREYKRRRLEFFNRLLKSK